MDQRRQFVCENGRAYLMPEKHCVFCAHCTDIYYDFSNGPYMFLCELDGYDYETCGKFEDE